MNRRIPSLPSERKFAQLVVGVLSALIGPLLVISRFSPYHRALIAQIFSYLGGPIDCSRLLLAPLR